VSSIFLLRLGTDFFVTPFCSSQLVEVLTLVKEQQSQRSVQTQQTSDIARCSSPFSLLCLPFSPSLTSLSVLPFLPDLNELNSWMEQFVKNGNQALDVVSTKVDHLTDLISPPPPATPQLGQNPVPMQQGIVGLLGEVRSLALELRDRAGAANGGEGGVGEAVQQRLEGVLAVMEQDRQRYQQQNSSECRKFEQRRRGNRVDADGRFSFFVFPSFLETAIDGMMVMINQHKMENEQLLRAVAVGEFDLRSIRRLRSSCGTDPRPFFLLKI